MDELLSVDVTVTATTRLSPHLVRLSVAGEALTRMPWGREGPGPRDDAYVKLLVPPPGGTPAEVDTTDMVSWRRSFMAADPAERGWLRTYTIRDARTRELHGTEVPELDVDVVLHEHPGNDGPGAAWARAAVAGDPARLLVPGPEGTWWRAWDASRAAGHDVVLAVDETALPAAAAVVDGLDGEVAAHGEDVPAHLVVAAEVPAPEDAVAGTGPRALSRAQHTLKGWTVLLGGGTRLSWHWLPRGGAPHGGPLSQWLEITVGARHDEAEAADGEICEDPEEDFVWSTAGADGQGTYWFLAAESGTVKAMRRACVAAGVPKQDITFMGYWKRGAATE